MSISNIPPYDFNIARTTYKDRERSALVFLARSAEKGERFDDMCRMIRELIKYISISPQVQDRDLTEEERNLFSIAYKNVIGSLRAAYRSLRSEDNKFEDIIDDYKLQLEKELNGICQDIIRLLDETLNKNVQKMESKVFFLKMTGDFYRYLAECSPGRGWDKKAAEYYNAAMKIASTQLQPTHPTRLGLALNYSVCFFEVIRDKKQACELAKSAFDQAISKLDDLDEASYKDCTLIMQLLRDNLTLWTSQDQEQEQ